MNRPLVLHLYDDSTAGGVMRVLEHISTNADMARDARHQLRAVSRGAFGFGRIDADVIVSHLTLNWRGLPGLIALRSCHPDTPMMHVEHSYTEAFVAQNVPSPTRFETMLRTAYALFDRVVAVSGAQRDWLAERGLVPTGSLKLIRSSVDLTAFSALPAPRAKVRVIGAIGRLDRQKGFDILIRALRAAPDLDLRLYIFGEGPERTTLESIAQGDPRIVVHGHNADPTSAMAQVDVVAMPSRWEAYGIVAREARAAGRGLIVAPVDGLRDHVSCGARAVADSTVAGWSTALRTLSTQAPASTPKRGDEMQADTFAECWRELLVEVLSLDNTVSETSVAAQPPTVVYFNQIETDQPVQRVA